MTDGREESASQAVFEFTLVDTAVLGHTLDDASLIELPAVFGCTLDDASDVDMLAVATAAAILLSAVVGRASDDAPVSSESESDSASLSGSAVES